MRSFQGRFGLVDGGIGGGELTRLTRRVKRRGELVTWLGSGKIFKAFQCIQVKIVIFCHTRKYLTGWLVTS